MAGVAERPASSGPSREPGSAKTAPAPRGVIGRQALVSRITPGFDRRPSAFEGARDVTNVLRGDVTLIGPRQRIITNLRILGPLRKESQVELAFTDAISLGIDAPIRLSGNIEGTPGCLVMGPKGVVELKRGVIRAAIHVHMNPDEAAHYGVRQRDLMNLRIGGDAGVTFNRVHVRIDPNARLNVHMDTDEANGCGLHLARDIDLFK